MTLLAKKDQDYLKEVFTGMDQKVRLVLFTKTSPDCLYCDQTEQILREVSGLSSKIELDVYDLEEDRALAAGYGVESAPATLILDQSGKDYGIRYYGIPSGYEFATLIEGIMDVSRHQTSLSEETKAKVANLDTDINIKVFVTPTCPYCPKAVRLGHQLALTSDRITAEAIEATEFPELATRFSVYGVPKTVINDSVEIEGAVPEHVFVDRVLQAARR